MESDCELSYRRIVGIRCVYLFSSFFKEDMFDDINEANLLLTSGF